MNKISFKTYEFDKMRDWLFRYPGSRSLRLVRMMLFAHYRYAEEYENIYEMVKSHGGDILD